MIAEEVVPAIHGDSSGQIPIVAAGASIGAFNAFAIQCRYPWLFRTSICMSGSYRLQRFLGGEHTPELYLSSPLDYLPGLDGPILDQLRHGYFLLASGEGAWEDIGESWAVADALGAKGIPNRVDSWGPDWEHGWDTWRAMLPAYLRELT
jgi:esterase/lipase superfamily enzyme